MSKKTVERNANLPKRANKSTKSLEKQIYIGPSFSGINQFTTFDGELPLALAQIQSDCSAFKKLTVEVKNFKNAFDNLNVKNSIESINFIKAINYLNKTKKGV